MNKSNFQGADDNMCKSCMLFYGCEAYQWLCSSCHKKNQTSKKEEQSVKDPELEAITQQAARKETSDTIEQAPEEPKQKDRKRCYDCRKKVGLLGIECKCGFVFCNAHRLPEEHTCSFDHQEAGKKKLEKEIIKVYNGKINQI